MNHHQLRSMFIIVMQVEYKYSLLGSFMAKIKT